MVMTPRDGSGNGPAQNLAQGLNLGKILGSQTQPKDSKNLKQEETKCLPHHHCSTYYYIKLVILSAVSPAKCKQTSAVFTLTTQQCWYDPYLGPDCLELTILKITGKISIVIYSLLFSDNSLLCWNIVDYLSNNKQKIDFFPI